MEGVQGGSGFSQVMSFIILRKYKTLRTSLPRLAEQRWYTRRALRAGNALEDMLVQKPRPLTFRGRIEDGAVTLELGDLEARNAVRTGACTFTRGDALLAQAFWLKSP